MADSDKVRRFLEELSVELNELVALLLENLSGARVEEERARAVAVQAALFVRGTNRVDDAGDTMPVDSEKVEHVHERALAVALVVATAAAHLYEILRAERPIPSEFVVGWIDRQ